MKRISFALFFGFLFLLGSLSAAMPSWEPALDPQVKTGILPNGLTYYMLKNAKPEHRIIIRLAVKAGSLDEADNQQGLAHLLEHMAFNGGKNFAKGALVDFLEKSGMRFGADLNAFTSYDSTVYQLELPTDNPTFLKQGLLVLQDWIQGLHLNEGLENEKLVVQEEWRMRTKRAGGRVSEWFIPLIFKGSPYAFRRPIGSMDIVKTATPEILKSLYERTYQPNRMALIFVGDVDPATLEPQIRQVLGEGPASSALPVPRPGVPAFGQRSIRTFSDPELSSNSVEMTRLEPFDFSSYAELKRHQLQAEILGELLNARFRDLAQSAQPPFLSADLDFGYPFWKNVERSLSVSFSDGQALKALEAMVTEVQKAKLLGFQKREFNQVRDSVIKSLETSYAQLKDVPSDRFADGLANYFTEGGPFPDTEEDLALSRKILQALTPEDLQNFAQKTLVFDQDLIAFLLVQKPGNEAPTEKQVTDSLAAVQKKTFAKEEEKAAGVLMKAPPAPGKILNATTRADLGITTWELSNGAVVYLKPTDYKTKEIIFRAVSPGGLSLVPDQDFWNAKMATTLLGEGGLGGLTQKEFNDYLRDKQYSVGTSIDETQTTLSGALSNPQDLESFFQVIHLQFTGKKKDPNSFESIQTRLRAYVANRLQDPRALFGDELARLLSNGNFRGQPLNEGILKGLNLDRAFELYQRFLGNPGNFRFFFVGDFKLETLKPLVETYLASLPGDHAKETPRDRGIRPVKLPYVGEIRKGIDPKVTVALVYDTSFALPPDDVTALSAVSEILNIRLREALRNTEGGTYGADADYEYDKTPYPHALFTVSFQCEPGREKELINSAKAVVEKVQKGLIEPEDLEKAKGILTRDLETGVKSNRFWTATMARYIVDLQYPDGLLKFQDRVNRISLEVLQPLVRVALDPKALLQLTLVPEGSK